MTAARTPMPPLPAAPPSLGTTPVWSSRGLFGASQIVFIDHGGQRYQLRITRENKLILTK